MKIGFGAGTGVVASWRADETDIPGLRRVELLRDSTGMQELPDDGRAICQVMTDVDMQKSIVLRNHIMRIEFPDTFDSVKCAFRDPAPTSADYNGTIWRGVRKLLFAGLIPHILKGRCAIVHGALLDEGDGAMILSGPSGIGKSTTALRFSERFPILADDCFVIYRDGERWMARPLPTWSTYLFGKSRLAICRTDRAIPVKRILLIGRYDVKYTPIDARESLLGMTPAFTDMILWHQYSLPEELSKKLRDAAMDAASLFVRSVPCGVLQLTLDCDIFKLFESIE